MYLHEAIRMALTQSGSPLSSSELARIIDRLHLYQRKDKGRLPARQITARAQDHPGIFSVNKMSGRAIIGLTSWTMNPDLPKVRDKAEAFKAIDRNASTIATIGDSIFAFAEVAMQEYETCNFVGGILKDIGFKVETGISGFPTAILATYGSGKPVIAVHTEYDALPGVSQEAGVTEKKPVVPGAPGHAEGHNCGSALALGALFAVKQAMDENKLPGTIKFFGVPAEELVLARPFFVRDGYFDDVDAAIWCHLMADFENSYGVRNYGNMSVEFESSRASARLTL